MTIKMGGLIILLAIFHLVLSLNAFSGVGVEILDNGILKQVFAWSLHVLMIV